MAELERAAAVGAPWSTEAVFHPASLPSDSVGRACAAVARGCRADYIKARDTAYENSLVSKIYLTVDSDLNNI